MQAPDVGGVEQRARLRAGGDVVRHELPGRQADDDATAIRHPAQVICADEAVGRDDDRITTLQIADHEVVRRQVGKAGAIRRHDGQSIAAAGDDDRSGAVDGIACADRARLVDEHDLAVGRGAEWGRHARAAAREEQGADDQADDEQHDGDGRTHRNARRHRQPVRESGHGEPPFGERPAGSLPRAVDLAEDVVEVLGGACRRERVEDHRQAAFEPIVRAHAICPPGTGSGCSIPASSSVARIARSDRCSRDFTVPRGIRSATATSGSGIPR